MTLRRELSMANSKCAELEKIVSEVTADLHQTEEMVHEFRSEFTSLKQKMSASEGAFKDVSFLTELGVKLNDNNDDETEYEDLMLQLSQLAA